MFRNATRRRRGVTAMELLVGLGVFTILGTGLFSLFSTSMEHYQRGTGKSNADDTASLVLQSIVRGIEDGKSAAIVGGGLEVRLPGVNDQGDYQLDVDGDLIRLFVSSGTLYRQVNGGAARILATGVASFTFNVVGGNLALQLTLSRTSGMRTSQTSFTQRVALRNYVSAS